LFRLHAGCFNYHDYVVLTGEINTPEGRIPMSNGAGEIVAVGEGAGFEQKNFDLIIGGMARV